MWSAQWLIASRQINASSWTLNLLMVQTWFLKYCNQYIYIFSALTVGLYRATLNLKDWNISTTLESATCHHHQTKNHSNIRSLALKAWAPTINRNPFCHTSVYADACASLIEIDNTHIPSHLVGCTHTKHIWFNVYELETFITGVCWVNCAVILDFNVTHISLTSRWRLTASCHRREYAPPPSAAATDGFRLRNRCD